MKLSARLVYSVVDGQSVDVTSKSKRARITTGRTIQTTSATFPSHPKSSSSSLT